VRKKTGKHFAAPAINRIAVGCRFDRYHFCQIGFQTADEIILSAAEQLSDGSTKLLELFLTTFGGDD
jgi:hypothetical protein